MLSVRNVDVWCVSRHMYVVVGVKKIKVVLPFKECSNSILYSKQFATST